MKETYKFKYILIAFRKEYIKINEELNNLKKYIKLLDESLKKMYVILEPDTSMIAIYFLEQKRNILEKLITIEKKYNDISINLNNLTLDTDIKSIYHLKNNIEHFHILIEDLDIFNKKIFDILNSNFVKYMNISREQEKYNNKSKNLEFDYNHLSQEAIDDNSSIKIFSYYPNKDFIKISSRERINQNLIENDILNTQYAKNLFNKYQQNLIENINLNFKIELIDDNGDNSIFDIIDEDNKIILKRQ